MNHTEARAQGLTVSFYALKRGWQYYATVEEAQEARAQLIAEGVLKAYTFLYDENGRIIPEEGLSSTVRYQITEGTA